MGRWGVGGGECMCVWGGSVCVCVCGGDAGISWPVLVV